MFMNRPTLKVLGLTTSQSHSGAYALILEEEQTKLRIPIVIGMSEAQSIAVALEGIEPKRPLTHDLLVSLAHSQNMRLLEAYIHRLEEGVFYSELLFKSGFRKIRMDARTSDAIALAVRFNAPIYTTEDIIKRAGISQERTNINEKDFERRPVSVEDQILALEEKLNDVVSQELYKEAAKIKQKIDELKKKL